MKRFTLFCALIKAPVYAYDKFDIQVCNAIKTNHARNQCLSELGIPKHIADNALKSAPTNTPITKSQILNVNGIAPYIDDVVIMLNRLKQTNTRCQQKLDPINAGISQSRSTPGNPSFFVQCGVINDIEVVRFTLDDIKATNAITASKHLDKNNAMAACRNRLKNAMNTYSNASIPVFGVKDYSQFSGGNVVVTYDFEATNAVGHNTKQQIKCYFNGAKLELSEIKKR
ncbi:hypothetical protein [Pseudoalteromonas spongiae]|uniref:hypothetical protein n=1 Tax=Pseudoalteromonas spongiae TaxID=298657 RepID=UPI000C2D34AC|nr:hypothetical protein [Pseudoalteromonas spongiae]